MNAESLLALYHRVADAPNAVPRLRRFMLDLAMRGKLVEQNPEFGGMTGEWRTVKLGDVCAIRSGNSIPAKKKEQLYTEVAGVPYVATKDVGFDGSIDYDNGIYIPEGHINKFKISPSGATLVCAEGGSAGRKIAFSDTECCFVNKLFSLEPNNEIAPKFLYYYTLNEQFQSQFKDALHGLIGGVSLKKINQFKISYPPLAEQRRIVAKVDELMALCDRLEKTRTAREETRDRLTKASHVRLRAPDTDDATFRSHARFAVDAFPALTARADQVKRFRQTILDLAVRGKLVKQDPVALRESRQGKGVSTPPHGSNAPKFGGMTGEWKTVKLGSIAEVKAGNSAPQDKGLFEDGRYHFVRTSDVGKIKVGVLNTSNDKLNDEGIKKLRLFSKGTILFPKSGASTFLNHRVLLGVDAYVSSHLATIKADGKNVIDEYLWYFLQTIDAANLVADSAYPSLQVQTIQAIEIPLPPLADQHRIVAKIEELTALCDRLEANLGAVDDSRHDLLESLLRNALEPAANEFEGGLEMA